MKTAKIILFTLAFAVPALANAQGNGSTPTKTKKKAWGELTPYEQAIRSSKIKGSRQININPIVPKDGIKKGCVVVYGHFMRPPFVVSYVDHKLLINEVQVEPLLLLERELKKEKPFDPKVLAIARKQIDVSKEIRGKYRMEKFWKSDARLKADMLAFTKSKDVVIDAKWDGDAFLVSFVNGTGFEFFDLKGIEMPKGWKQKTHSEMRKEGEDDKIKYVRETLESDGCIVFSSNGDLGIIDPRDIVNKVMSDKTLSKETKANLLADKVFLGVYDEAFNVLENYNAGEWSKQ